MPPLTRKELLEKNEQIWQIIGQGLAEARQESLDKFIQDDIDRRHKERAKKEQRNKEVRTKEIEIRS